MKRITIYKTFSFEASHILPRHPGKCSRLHGHSWKLSVGVSGEVNSETGFVVDYSALGALVQNHIINHVDHRHLGQGTATLGKDHFAYTPYGEAFYPSSEQLVTQFAMILLPAIQQELNVQLEEVSLEETCTCKAVWRRQDA